MLMWGINRNFSFHRKLSVEVTKSTRPYAAFSVCPGHETKALLNNNGPRYKRSKLECQLNRDVIWCVLVLFLMCALCAIGKYQ